MNMQPIDTAPTDGTHILLYGDHEDDMGEFNHGLCEGYMNSCHGWYHIVGLPSYPTHWCEIGDIKT